MKAIMVVFCLDERDPALSFIPFWCNAISEHVEVLHVIPQWVRKHCKLENNIIIHSLEKDKYKSKTYRFFKLYKIVNDIMNKYGGADICFVHMNTIMAPVLWPILSLYKVPIISWYAHNHIDKTIPFTHFVSKKIVTSVPAAYTYRHDDKVLYIGQGINEKIFVPSTKNRSKDGLLHVGRISPIKGLTTLVRGMALIDQDVTWASHCNLIGVPPIGEDGYYNKIKNMAEEFKVNVNFCGAKKNIETVKYYQNAAYHISCGPKNNSMDKAVLESLFCGTPCLTSIKSFDETFGIYADQLIFKEHDPHDLAEKIKQLPDPGSSEYEIMINYLYKRVLERHSLSSFSRRLVSVFENNLYRR
ncbi:MAG: glycosyltransferase [Desulfovibrio piger]|uniref:glycosyltransferase n=1 Tax=Desulfovibrio piger TaxID=901 RepID=UPI003993BD3C